MKVFWCGVRKAGTKRFHFLFGNKKVAVGKGEFLNHSLSVSAETPTTVVRLHRTELRKDFTLSDVARQLSFEMSDT